MHLPQRERTPEQDAEFEEMLHHVNLLFLGMPVLVCDLRLDPQYAMSCCLAAAILRSADRDFPHRRSWTRPSSRAFGLSSRSGVGCRRSARMGCTVRMAGIPCRMATSAQAGTGSHSGASTADRPTMSTAYRTCWPTRASTRCGSCSSSQT